MYYFFYLPIGTELRVRRFPSAVAALAVIDLGYFLLFTYSPVHAARLGALALDTAHPSLLTAFTACFLHADWFHLLGNLAYLGTFGPAIEDRLGGARFLLLYLACGVGAMLLQVEANALHLPGQAGPSVLGASGAIAGVLGLFAARCWFARVKVAHLTLTLPQGRSRVGTTRLNSLVAIGAWSFLQVVYALITGASGPGGTAYAAHIGGLLLGLGLGFLLGLHRQGAVERIWVLSRRRIDAGDWFGALKETAAYLGRAPRDIEAWLQLGRIQSVLRRPIEAQQAYLKAVDILWKGRDWEGAVAVARELRRQHPAARLRPAILYRMALFLERNGDLGWAANTFHDYSLFYPDHDRAPAALLKAAEIEARYRNDLGRADDFYRELAERFPDTPEATAALDRLRAVARIRETGADGSLQPAPG